MFYSLHKSPLVSGATKQSRNKQHPDLYANQLSNQCKLWGVLFPTKLHGDLVSERNESHWQINTLQSAKYLFLISFSLKELRCHIGALIGLTHNHCLSVCLS